MNEPHWAGAFDPAVMGGVTALPIPEPVREWAWGAGTWGGVKVAVIDSGVDAEHPRVGGLAGAIAFETDADAPSGYRAVEGLHEDLVGHGTACAAIIRMLVPDAEIYSVRVLGPNLRGNGALFLAGIRWAIQAGVHVANLSLSSSSDRWFGPLHSAADDAYFSRTLLVCAANNMPGPTYPSQYASVVSVAARPGQNPEALARNPNPPVEFGACGIDVDVAWANGGSIKATGNSFAAPHVAGLAARILSRHPGLAPFEVKAVLAAIADNAVISPG